ncbi:Bug family tripartite tricarboxylate transporter substrate binding protein [Xanthobacter oligotrophicus]|uniref:Bug family tripartite tricarboxylate transporter substrate binding protein n=1 Tax=Xanthobacter oligotrophicus TaxID=2607286 RepID=UPI001AEEC183|nr:tripartite tricarboxylate transporter substrate binding protein [Xanthobacter oligotrophicus]MCG5234352.1 tripartite tricarboxylate transporter substrate binding protein [Xanthobacter oligotrophicus]
MMRIFGASAMAAALVLAGGVQARAEAWPTRPITLVVGFAAGGASDGTARILAERLQEELKQPVVVENRPGAGTMIATNYVSRAAPDGYTFLVGSSGHTINPGVHKQVRYDPVKDFASVTLVGSLLHVLVVRNELPAQNVAELIALAKAKPGEITYASVGAGTSTHLEAELFAAMAGIQLTHIPYKGSAPALIDLTAGRVDMMFDAVASSLPLVNGGRIRALGVVSAQRSALLPNVPTIAESGLPGYEAMPWFGILAPAGIDPAIVEKMNVAIQKIIAEPSVKERFAKLGADIIGYGPEKFSAFIAVDLKKWADIARRANIQIAE